jgi:hypothetical protein
MDMLLMAVCAVISGAAGWEDLEEEGQSHAEWLTALREVPQGIPGHDTCRRVFSRLDPAECTQGFLAWTPALREASGGALVASDGTTLRHAFAQATATAALPMVRAWASANRFVLGQRTGAETSHAMTAMPYLLPWLDLTGAVVTSAAMGGQQELAKTRTEPGADDG